MTDLAGIFNELGLTQYLDIFIGQGFDNWETILDIQESDFELLGVKLGHRRKLQRKIAAYRGIGNEQALGSHLHHPTSTEDEKTSDDKRTLASKPDAKDGSQQQQLPTGKRKYRRHPKPDENAPERPPSAYVIFSNKMREDLKGRNLSFTDIAKLVGEHWQNLTPLEKEPFEQQAFTAKEKYNIALADYRKTENFRNYTEYLQEFKAKHQQQHESTDASSENSKRPKLEPRQSPASSTTNKASSGSLSRELVRESSSGVSTRSRNESSGSTHPTWQHMEGATGASASLDPRSNVHERQVSPQGGSRSLISGPRYGEAALAPGMQTLPWKDQFNNHTDFSHGQQGQRPDRTASQASSATISDPGREPSFGTSHQHSRRLDGFTPALLTSESSSSTNWSNASSGSMSTQHFGPRTPLDSSLDMPLPSILSGTKLASTFDTQLPPLRHASLSPQNSMNSAYTVPSVTMDYAPLSQGSQRHDFYSAQRPQRGAHAVVLNRTNSSFDTDTSPLDPVTALLRAGEMVDSQNRHYQNQYPQHPSPQPPVPSNYASQMATSHPPSSQHPLQPRSSSQYHTADHLPTQHLHGQQPGQHQPPR